MAAQDNRRLVNELLNALNAHDADGIARLFAEDIVKRYGFVNQMQFVQQ